MHLKGDVTRGRDVEVMREGSSEEGMWKHLEAGKSEICVFSHLVQV